MPAFVLVPIEHPPEYGSEVPTPKRAPPDLHPDVPGLNPGRAPQNLRRLPFRRAAIVSTKTVSLPVTCMSNYGRTIGSTVLGDVQDNGLVNREG